jgi:phosphoglycolate phosphatase
MKKFILFDFDGVIVDSFRPAYEVVKMMCSHTTEEDYKKRFEGNVNDWEAPIDIHTPECRTDLEFFTEYVPRIRKEVIIMPGIKEIILELEKQYTLIIISSTITSPIKELLGDFGLTEHFDWVMGNDVHKSKVEKMKMVFEKYGITSKDCVFITDTLGDMREAEKVDVGVIGVTWGFHSLETLNKGKYYSLVNKPDELPEAVSKHFNQI